MSDVAGFASSFLSAVVNFIIMAFILFCLMKGINKLTGLTKKEEAPAEPETKICPYCQSEISIKATRCPHCNPFWKKQKQNKEYAPKLC